MIQLRTVFLSLVLGAVSTASWSLERQAMLDGLLVDTGLNRQIEQWPLVFQGSLEAEKAKVLAESGMPEEMWSSMSEGIAEAFSADAMSAILRNEMDGNLSDDQLLAIAQEYEKPYLKKITEIEVLASSPQGAAQVQECVAAINDLPVTEERVALIEKLDVGVGATELSVEVYRNLLMAMSSAMNLSLPRDQQLSLDRIEEQIAEVIDPIKGQLQYVTIASYVCIYQDTDDSDLNRYISFLATPAGLSFVKAADTGVKKGFAEAGFRWGEALVEIGDRLEKEDRL